MAAVACLSRRSVVLVPNEHPTVDVNRSISVQSRLRGSQLQSHSQPQPRTHTIQTNAVKIIFDDDDDDDDEEDIGDW